MESFSVWYTRLYSKFTDYDQEIIDPMEKIKIELHVKTLLGTFVTMIIGIFGLHLVLPMNIATNLLLVIIQIGCALGMVRLYYKKPQHLGTMLSVISMIIAFSGTYSDEKMMLCGLAFLIVLPGFLAFLTQSKRMAFIGLIYSIVLNIVIGPRFYEMILREYRNQNLADLLDSSRITFNVFAFYEFAFTTIGDNRFNKILNTLAITLKAEEQMKQEKELLHSKSMFFSCFSHEMRNPLNCILGSMDYAIKYATDDVICDILSTGKACGSLLLNLINNILDMGKLDSNNICLNEDMRDSKQFITNIWRVTQELFKKKKQVGEIFIDKNFPAYINIDDTRLTQVVVNLISNACKFTGEGKTIRVAFSFERGDQIHTKTRSPSLNLAQMTNHIESTEAIIREGGPKVRTKQPVTSTLICEEITPRWITSFEDNHIEQTCLDRLAENRSKKTLHHVNMKSQQQAPSTQGRYINLFTTSGETFKEMAEWDPQNSPLKSQKGTIKIEVIDSGCGMTEDEVSKLFKPFIQANKTITGTYGGTGLGLYITQSLTHLMRGTVTVKSQVKVGSTFTVSIPNDPSPSFETTSTGKLMKSHSQFSRFKIVLCYNRSETNSSWRRLSTELYEFTEKMSNQYYRLEQVDHFVLPHAHKSPSTFLKTYFVYDVSSLTAQNILELQNLQKIYVEHSVFFYSSKAANTNLPVLIPQIMDSEVVANEIHNQTKELLCTIKSQRSILIVDDDEFNRKIFSVFLAREGYNIYTAQNGQEGFEVYCQHPKDIAMVIVDYEMPICDGPTCAEKILKHVKDHNMSPVPIHALTGNVSQESKTRLAQAGIKKAWNKPAKLEEIMDEIFYVVTK